jgi:hypothetical protein
VHPGLGPDADPVESASARATRLRSEAERLVAGIPASDVAGKAAVLALLAIEARLVANATPRR